LEQTQGDFYSYSPRVTADEFRRIYYKDEVIDENGERRKQRIVKDYSNRIVKALASEFAVGVLMDDNTLHL